MYGFLVAPSEKNPSGDHDTNQSIPYRDQRYRPSSKH